MIFHETDPDKPGSTAFKTRSGGGKAKLLEAHKRICVVLDNLVDASPKAFSFGKNAIRKPAKMVSKTCKNHFRTHKNG
jgi:hypothetical protein